MCFNGLIFHVNMSILLNFAVYSLRSDGSRSRDGTDSFRWRFTDPASDRSAARVLHRQRGSEIGDRSQSIAALVPTLLSLASPFILLRPQKDLTAA